jgi:hypothetical protein
MRGSGFSNNFLKVFFMCKEFHSLPFDGGYFDQPTIWIDAFEIIQGVINEYEAAERKKVK